MKTFKQFLNESIDVNNVVPLIDKIIKSNQFDEKCSYIVTTGRCDDVLENSETGFITKNIRKTITALLTDRSFVEKIIDDEAFITDDLTSMIDWESANVNAYQRVDSADAEFDFTKNEGDESDYKIAFYKCENNDGNFIFKINTEDFTEYHGAFSLSSIKNAIKDCVVDAYIGEDDDIDEIMSDVNYADGEEITINEDVVCVIKEYEILQ